MNRDQVIAALGALEHEVAMVAHEEVAFGDPRVCVFGSTPMGLAGIREVGDVDAFVSRGVFERLVRRDGWVLLRPREDDPPLLEFVTAWGPLHVFYEWTERDASWVSAAMCWEAAVVWRAPLLWMIPMVTVARIKAGCLGTLAAQGVDPVGTVWEKHVTDLELLRRRGVSPMGPGFDRLLEAGIGLDGETFG